MPFLLVVSRKHQRRKFITAQFAAQRAPVIVRISTIFCAASLAASTSMSQAPLILCRMTLALRATSMCTYCDDDLEHCHGVAIVADFTSVCSDDPNCEVSMELHQFVAIDE
jgi:hypothetical protein